MADSESPSLQALSDSSDQARLEKKVKKLKSKVKELTRKLRMLEKVVNCSIAHF